MKQIKNGIYHIDITKKINDKIKHLKAIGRRTGEDKVEFMQIISTSLPETYYVGRKSFLDFSDDTPDDYVVTYLSPEEYPEYYV